jgi:hypothetical protein
MNLSEQPEGVRAVAPLARSAGGGSAAFLLRADDGNRYWCKTLQNPQGPRVPVNEQIVGRLGRLIVAAVCDVNLVYIPPDLVGWEYTTGLVLGEGWIHGSKAVPDAIETHQLEHRNEDANARRHASFFAMYDWLWGDDPQWLVASLAENKYYSHDHGYFLGGAAWEVAAINGLSGARELSQDSNGLDQEEIGRLANALEDLTHENLERELSKMPETWPISALEAEAVVGLADSRRIRVATRLRSLV